MSLECKLIQSRARARARGGHGTLYGAQDGQDVILKTKDLTCHTECNKKARNGEIFEQRMGPNYTLFREIFE